MEHIWEFLKTLNPVDYGWNAFIFLADVAVAILGRKRYKATKSRQLRNALPGIYTSLGLLGTFGAICTSLSGISTETGEHLGKTVGDVSALTGDLKLEKIISDLIPAFSTSIYGLVFAIVSSIWSKLEYANEDCKLEKELKYPATEQLLESMGDNLKALTELTQKDIEANSQNNKELKEVIQVQNSIFSNFVENFVKEMEGTFQNMKDSIGERVSAFGEEQFEQSKKVLEGFTAKLNDETQALGNDHRQAVKTMSESIENAVNDLKVNTINDMNELVSAQQKTLQGIADENIQSQLEQLGKMRQYLEEQATAQKASLEKYSQDSDAMASSHIQSVQAITAAQHEALKKLSDDSFQSHSQQIEIMKHYTEEQNSLYKSSIEKQNEFNSKLINDMSSSLYTTMGLITSSITEQCNSLQKAIADNVEMLEKAYGFIDQKSSDMVSNYQQSVESFRMAVQNAHDYNSSFAKSVNAIDESLKTAQKTNKGVNDVISVIQSKETNIEAIVMRIEELGKAITSLQRLEATLSKITSK